ncbi:E3 ubiquitin-protein ligase TRIM45-like [Littorina saxatilis]|uniref:Uncharacterized protein n=1 Tax=Littorina saxatilis TaxID=31220 RepID=A0AAN9G4I2_9CAEN
MSMLTRLKNSFRKNNGRVSETAGRNGPASPKTGRSSLSSPKTGRSSLSSPKTGLSAEGQSRSGNMTDVKAMLKAEDGDSAKDGSVQNAFGVEQNTSGNTSIQDDFETERNTDEKNTSGQNAATSAQNISSQSSTHQNISARNNSTQNSSPSKSNSSNNISSSTSLQSSSSSLTMTSQRKSKSSSLVDTAEDVEHDDATCPKSNNTPVDDSDESYDNLPFADARDENVLDTTHDISFKDTESTMENVEHSEEFSTEGLAAETFSEIPDGDCGLRRTARSSEIPDEDYNLRRTAGSANPNRASFGANLQEVLGRAEEAGSLKNSGKAGMLEDTSAKIKRLTNSFKADNVVREESAADPVTSGGVLVQPNRANPIAAAACVIPQTLKKSPSTPMLGLHRRPAEDLTCRVCNELFKKPRILPCLHTFCTTCVINLQTYPINVLEERSHTPRDLNPEADSRELLSPSPVQGSTSSASTFSQKSGSSHKSSDSSTKNEDQQRSGKRVVLCPTCLKETRVSRTVEELPRNYVMERRVAEDVAARGGVIRLECDSCAEFSESTRVTVRCMDCAENLCSLCELAHRRQKKTKRHQLIDVTPNQTSENSPVPQHTSQTNGNSSSNHRDRKNHVLSKVPPPRQINCNRHPEEELKLFCMSCDLPICRDCVVVDHRDHDCQFLCQELFRQQMSEVQQMIRSVVPRITAVDQQLKKVSDTQDAIRSRADDVINEINQHMDTYLSAIQQHRQRLLQQVGAVVEEKQHALHVTERHLRHVRSDVEQTCRFVSDMIENASDVEILSVKRLVTDRLTGLKQLVTGVQHQPVSTFLKFSSSEKGEVVNKFQMFGRVISRKASAAASTIFTEGLSTARVSHDSSVVLRVNSEDGAQYTGKDVQIKAWLIFQNQSIRSRPVGIHLQKNGTYSLKFTPVQQGSHFLHVAVDSQPVKDSPFKFKVKAQWRQHKGVWQCCTMCSSGGRMDVPCGCRGTMPGGQSQGCSHGQPGHPGGQHWSCCGKMVRTSECPGVPMPRQSPVRQVTL